MLGSLSRVRAIHLNDAHIFSAREELADEIAEALSLLDGAHQALGEAVLGLIGEVAAARGDNLVPERPSTKINSIAPQPVHPGAA